MKKLLLIFVVFPVILLPVISFAAIHISPLSGSDLNSFIFTCTGNFYSSYFILYNGNTRIGQGDQKPGSACSGSTPFTLSDLGYTVPGYGTYTMASLDSNGNFSPQQYCGTLSNCQATAESYSEGFTYLDFTYSAPLPPPASHKLFSLSSSTAPGLTANVSDTLANPGLLAVVIFALGLPAVFWVIHRIRELAPSESEGTFGEFEGSDEGLKKEPRDVLPHESQSEYEKRKGI